MNIRREYVCHLEANQKLKFTFIVDVSANHICYYELQTKQTLLKDSRGRISEVYCVAEKYYGHNGATAYPKKAISKELQEKKFNYSSLEDAYNKIHTALCSSPTGTFPKLTDYLDAIEYFDEITSNWKPIKPTI